MTKFLLAAAALVASTSSLAHAQNSDQTPAQGLSGQEKTVVFVQAMAERGRACELLTPWQSAAIAAQTLEQTRDWNKAKRQRVGEAVTEKSASMACDNEGMNGWIDASSRGFDTEFLPPYLVIYRTLAVKERPPMVFDAIALRHDFTAAIDAIDKSSPPLRPPAPKQRAAKAGPTISSTPVSGRSNSCSGSTAKKPNAR